MDLPFGVKQLLLSVHPPCLGQLYKPKEQFWYDDTDIVYYIDNYMCYSHISSDWDITLQERNFKTEFSLRLLPSTASRTPEVGHIPQALLLTATANTGVTVSGCLPGNWQNRLSD